MVKIFLFGFVCGMGVAIFCLRKQIFCNCDLPDRFDAEFLKFIDSYPERMKKPWIDAMQRRAQKCSEPKKEHTT